jgi:hypothetical protein
MKGMPVTLVHNSDCVLYVAEPTSDQGANQCVAYLGLFSVGRINVISMPGQAGIGFFKFKLRLEPIVIM